MTKILHRLLFLITSLGNTVQKTSKIGQFFFCGRHNYMMPNSNIKKLVSNVFSFGASLTVKQAPSFLSIGKYV